MNCDHEYIERERGREEPEEDASDGFVELVCARCGHYKTVNTQGWLPETTQPREVRE